MILNVEDHSRYLYHYTSAETAIEAILQHGTLRLSEYSKTNDPKESKDWLFDFGTSDPSIDLAAYSRDEWSSWLSAELKRDTRVVCFSQDIPGLAGNHMVDIFKRGYCKPRMWAQYANRHKGVCLVFDRVQLERRMKAQLARHAPFLSGAVQYRDHGIATDPFTESAFTINVDALEHYGRDQYPMAHLQRHHKQLFFEKMSDWAAENEYRWVAFSKSAAPLDVRYGSALVGMMFGDDTSDQHKREMVLLTSGKGVEARTLEWKNHTPWYDFGRFTYL